MVAVAINDGGYYIPKLKKGPTMARTASKETVEALAKIAAMFNNDWCGTEFELAEASGIDDRTMTTRCIAKLYKDGKIDRSGQDGRTKGSKGYTWFSKINSSGVVREQTEEEEDTSFSITMGRCHVRADSRQFIVTIGNREQYVTDVKSIAKLCIKNNLPAKTMRDVNEFVTCYQAGVAQIIAQLTESIAKLPKLPK